MLQRKHDTQACSTRASTREAYDKYPYAVGPGSISRGMAFSGGFKYKSSPEAMVVDWKIIVACVQVPVQGRGYNSKHTVKKPSYSLRAIGIR